MKFRFASVFTLLLMAAAALQLAPGAFGQAAGTWVTLFDGTSLNGWNRQGDANWALVDGAVQANQGAGFLFMSGPYADFDLRVEFWVDSDANSGVFIRCENPQQVSDTSCYEVNIYDKRPDPAYRTGGIVDTASPIAQVNAGGRWSTYEISARGTRLTVSLNGTRTIDTTSDKHARGGIGLQYGEGTVKFRKVEIRTY
jgi:hypothetical protein